MNAGRKIKQKVEAVMQREEKAPLLSLASVLYLISLFYGAGLKLREFAYRRKIMPSHQLPCRVICIGNLALGGTGKTPMTMHVAQEVRRLGYKVAVVSRGYGGAAESQGGVVSDGGSVLMGPQLAGDEPYMIASRLGEIPVIVGKNRFAAGMLAYERFRPDVVVLDDGFQHLKLGRDIDIVLLDHGQPFGNSHLLPRGTLREPVSSLARCSACILTRYQAGREHAAATHIGLIKKIAPQIPLFTSSYAFYCYTIECGERISAQKIDDPHAHPDMNNLTKDRVFGFCGIARNADFQNTVRNLGFNAGQFMEFSDHHHYTNQDLTDIQTQAEGYGASRLITTEKDLVRLAPRNPFSLELIVVGLRVSFGEEQKAFSSFIQKRLSL